MDAPLHILRTEREWLVVDKPAGPAVHSSPDGSDILVRLQSAFPGEPLAAVHRLDAATSGCLLVARTKRAFRFLARAFSERQVRKSYLAVVRGYPDPEAGEIFTHLGESSPGSGRMIVVDPGAGPIALTVFRTLSRGDGRTLVEAEPITGRTHQLRVHFRHLGHPILGDTVYGFPGDPVAARLLLHARRIEFPDPERPGLRVVVESDMHLNEPELRNESLGPQSSRHC